ncbi:hypothetical protein SNOG_05182 [Parastagonospora nodorum SN15]|uniref:Uncharacterized protein n=1 Tax=Phaeosphaeria nodorum (strain SN15 / ATCC MYA-4574 / FGSC 10173) TaxID=321614 RepID=Q0UST2_PHANO|nr:hypothetical protein SNOG_05182 [Parastagonospora nodorum SN15]EAT87573.1 hypothetical protein SNOG_05182 [Parastagonospora nodorum SN15]
MDEAVLVAPLHWQCKSNRRQQGRIYPSAHLPISSDVQPMTNVAARNAELCTILLRNMAALTRTVPPVIMSNHASSLFG